MTSLVASIRRRLRDSHQSPREVSRSDREWRGQLSAEQYRILRAGGTERPFSGVDIHPSAEAKTFSCAGCHAELFTSTDQFDSGTGWPSFTDALDGAVELSRSLSLGASEAVCRRCGGHLGHRFQDGPQPTGMRYCINSGALVSAETDSS